MWLLLIIPVVSATQMCVMRTVPAGISSNRVGPYTVYGASTPPLINSQSSVDLIANLTNDWVGFGDSRTDKTLPSGYWDAPAAVVARFSSLSGNALMVSNFVPAANSEFAYQGCGVEKIFYEGVNWMPGRYTCLMNDWTQIKYDFYKAIYGAAATHRCLSYNTVVPSETTQTELYSGIKYCNSGTYWFTNPQIRKFDFTSSNCGTPRSTYFTLPVTSGNYTCSEHVVSLCWFTYYAQDPNDCSPYFQIYQHPNGTNITDAGIDYKTDAYSSSAAFQCKTVRLPPGKYRSFSSARIQLVPTRSYCFGGGDATHVSHVESIWQPTTSLINDNSCERACKDTPKCIFYKRNLPYAGTNDAQHGDLELRRRFMGLLTSNTTCVFSGGSFQGAVLAANKYALPSAGKCPLAVNTTLPSFPTGEQFVMTESPFTYSVYNNTLNKLAVGSTSVVELIGAPDHKWLSLGTGLMPNITVPAFPPMRYTEKSASDLTADILAGINTRVLTADVNQSVADYEIIKYLNNSAITKWSSVADRLHAERTTLYTFLATYVESGLIEFNGSDCWTVAKHCDDVCVNAIFYSMLDYVYTTEATTYPTTAIQTLPMSSDTTTPDDQTIIRNVSTIHHTRPGKHPVINVYWCPYYWSCRNSGVPHHKALSHVGILIVLASSIFLNF
ncbi:hypothetical protein [Ranid herpesvirus 3]|uniref:sialate O-acetylesterase n=1 Tax=Ranid herpesvirus 3 TaxID=1987509 RepID=A0A1X9T5J5_9VIRU|nr:hypothetical protein [Ranid herpesvirus 3]ARR28970.1 hypothetical protein [Ranid herpesvirus 3]